MNGRNSALIALALAASFGLGRWYDSARVQADSGQRRPLYYQCPMHPATRSDKPGAAPDCGMPMVPVYAEKTEPADHESGIVHVSPDKQQLIGVRVGTAEPLPGQTEFRTSGQVVPDEARVFHLTTKVEGTIREVFANSTGSFVRRGEPLISVYSKDLQTSQQAYIFALNQIDRFRKGDDPDAMDRLELNLSEARANLENIGMYGPDIDAVGKARKIFPTVKLVAPADGFVTMRNVYTEQHFDKGVELYRIVDLSHVWIMADLFEDQMAGAQPAAGTSVSIRLPGGEEIPARLSNALPQFDPSTRVTKIRVEAENPHSALKPDMFVDLRFATRGKPGLSVPRDSVIDSGLSKTVFIAKGNGYFEPRAVQTGWRSGGRVQIVSGLKPGEQIVISGNFLLDSESRLKSGTENADDQPHH